MANQDYMLGTAGSEVKMSANDAMVQDYVEDINRQVRLGGGKLVTYNIAQMFHWQWAYKYLYGRSGDVFDGGMGRNNLLALYKAGNDMSFLVPNDQGGQTAYTVHFAAKSWREKHVWRNGANLWAWELSFELVQVS